MRGFQDALSNKRRYPVEQFGTSWDAGKGYAELTRNGPLLARPGVPFANQSREVALHPVGGKRQPPRNSAPRLSTASPGMTSTARGVLPRVL